MMSRHQAAHGLTGAPSQYALIDNARRARLGQTREEYAAAMGALFAPFTRVAAANPHAAAPVERSAGGTGHADRGEPADRRPVHPLPRRPGEGQPGRRRAADVGRARRGGSACPPDRWVFLHGHADLRERDLLDRADLSASPASAMAARHALEVAGIGAGRPGHHRPVQLLPRAGVQHLRRARPRPRRPARPHRHRRAAVLRRRGQQLLHARHRRDGAARPRQRPAATASSAPTAAS